jgi:very-short-patch-repair endonuclease
LTKIAEKTVHNIDPGSQHDRHSNSYDAAVGGYDKKLGKHYLRIDNSKIKNYENNMYKEFVTVKSEAIACARRCRSSRLTGWQTKKE